MVAKSVLHCATGETERIDVARDKELQKSIVFVYNTARYLLNLRGDLIKLLVSKGIRVSAIVPRDNATPGLEALGVTVFDWNLSGHGINPWREWASYRARRR